MSSYDTYVLLMCIVVFVLLTALSVFCVVIITKQSLRIINGGLDDEKIVSNYTKKSETKNKTKYAKLADIIVSSVVCLLFAIVFISSIAIQCTENFCCSKIPAYRVVQTGSMAEKNEKNTYLFKNNLNDQIQTFDLIRTEKLPDQFDLKLYDIVVYEVDDILLVHRIVGIEEPNQYHPNERYFRLQGDAVEAADRFPVKYEQMRAIYTGDRIPFVGSFVLFMQSFAGWLCMGLVLFAVIATPILESKIQKAEIERVRLRAPSILAKIEENNKKRSGRKK